MAGTQQSVQCLSLILVCVIVSWTAQAHGQQTAGAPVATPAQSSNARTLKQSPLDLLQLVEPDDPFAGAEDTFQPTFGLLSSLVQSAVGFVQQRQQQLWQVPWGLRSGFGGLARNAYVAGRPTGNATHTYRFSHTMQIHIPQPWDTVNMSQILKDNLEADLLFWQQLEYVPSVQDIFDQARNHPGIAKVPHTRRLVEIRNNTLRFPLMLPGKKQTECDVNCDPQLFDFVVAMKAAVSVFNLTLPDVVFIVNTDDAPVCNQEQVLKRECKVPIISLSKNTPMADLIAPVMRKSDAEVMHKHAPWESKKSMAFFRGVPSCGDMPFPPRCARSLVARLAQVNYSHVLDAGLVEEYNKPDQVRGDPVLRDGNGSLPVLPRVSMSELPKYKWLLNLDGHVAAYRLANLLAVNSLVLKQQSDKVEYYYRSLRPFHHYVPIFKSSEHDLMQRIEWATSHEEIVKRIIGNANHFAMRYTTYKARIMYWKYVLLAYQRLIPDMSDYFRMTSQQYQQMARMEKARANVSYLEALLQQQVAALPEPGGV